MFDSPLLESKLSDGRGQLTTVAHIATAAHSPVLLATWAHENVVCFLAFLELRMAADLL